jgi:hypothetical protein
VIVRADTVVGFALIGILGFGGCVLAKKVTALSVKPKMAEAIEDTSQRLPFRSEAGIDLSGRTVFPLPPPGVRHTVVFMLRGASVQTDLAFWRKVESLLPKNAAIRLVGYCDGDVCVNAVRGEAVAPDFPVIAYGEITGSQALLNADAQGNSFLLSEEWFQPKRISWRAPVSTPQAVVQEAIQ